MSELFGAGMGLVAAGLVTGLSQREDDASALFAVFYLIGITLMVVCTAANYLGWAA